MFDTSFTDHLKIAAQTTLWGATYGFAAGSLAGYVATAFKAAKAANFISLGVAATVYGATNSLLTYLAERITPIQNLGWGARLIVNKVAIPTISLVAAIYALPYANPTTFAITAIIAGFTVGWKWINSVETYKVPEWIAP